MLLMAFSFELLRRKRLKIMEEDFVKKKLNNAEVSSASLSSRKEEDVDVL